MWGPESMLDAYGRETSKYVSQWLRILINAAPMVRDYVVRVQGDVVPEVAATNLWLYDTSFADGAGFTIML